MKVQIQIRVQHYTGIQSYSEDKKVDLSLTHEFRFVLEPQALCQETRGFKEQAKVDFISAVLVPLWFRLSSWFRVAIPC